MKEATVQNTENGTIGVTCPHCHNIVFRYKGYYQQLSTTDKCPKCLKNYIVNLESLLRISKP